MAFQIKKLLQTSRDPLFLLNGDGRIVYFNPACETLTGVPAGKMVGQECRLQAPTEGDPPANLAASFYPPPEALGGKPATIQTLLMRADGQRSWHTVHFTPLAGADGEIAAILGRIGDADSEAPAVGTSEPLRQALARMRLQLWQRFGFDHVVAISPTMRRVLQQMQLASQSKVAVLLRGEKGVGKETLARTIHYQSPARERPFVGLDCAGLPTAALEQHLSEEGLLAATQQSVGVIYLREPAALPRDLQVRLSQMLEGPALPNRPRFLAGSAVDLERAGHDGSFLDTLYCRLSTLIIDVPPLRERGRDLPLLVQQLLERANADSKHQVHCLHPQAWEIVRGYAWPGNLAEFDAVLRKAHAQTPAQEIHASDLPAWLRSAVELAAVPPPPPDRPLPLDQLLESVEGRLIRLALRQSRGNLTKAAERLGIWRARLHRRMKHFGLADDSAEDTESDGPINEPEA